MKQIQLWVILILLFSLAGCYQPPKIEEIPSCSGGEELVGRLCIAKKDDVVEEVFCADNEVVHNVCIDKTAPDILGAMDKEIALNSTFDPLLGVVAIDDVDGVITNLLEVQNFVETSKLGIYIVKYKVSDISGNITELVRYVTVSSNPLTGGLGQEMAFNGDFSNGLIGWTILNNYNDGSANIFVNAENVLVIDIQTVHETDYWVPRVSLEGMTFETGKTYQVQFEMWADEQRLFHLQIGELLDAEPWFTDFRFGAGDKVKFIQTVPQTYTVVFTMVEEYNTNGGIHFEFGHVGDSNLLTTIYLDNISVKEMN